MSASAFCRRLRPARRFRRNGKRTKQKSDALLRSPRSFGVDFPWVGVTDLLH